MWREITTARGFVATRPRAKRSGGARQERDLIEAAAANFGRAYSDGGWPRKRADVALDVWAVGTKDIPAPHNFAKRLLDQLGTVDGRPPIVYHDDRQVTMLYVRVDEIADATPAVHFTAQRASVIRDEIRRAPDHAEHDYFLEREREFEERLDTARDWITDYRGDTSSMGRKFYDMGVSSERFYLQANTLHTTDYLAQSLVRQYLRMPTARREPFLDLTATSLDYLATMPYAFDLGTLPPTGGTGVFTRSVHDAIAARLAQYPMLFAPRMPVGVTAFYVPGHDGKDLDNALREVFLPRLFEQCHLTREARHPYAEADAVGGQSGIAFIEGIALKGIPRPPGTLIVALSNGWRHRSWWRAAIDGDDPLGSYPY